MIQKLHTPRGDVDIVDLTGQPENGDASKDGRIVGCDRARRRQTSFYKMRGNADLVGARKQIFSNGSAQSAAIPAAIKPCSSRCRRQRTSRRSNGKSRRLVACARIRHALREFHSADDNGGKIDISIVTFPGDGGNDLDNVNRWRQQIGLPPADESALSAVVVR